MTGTIVVDARNDNFSVGETQDISANLLANDVVTGSTAQALGVKITAVNVPGLGNVAVGTQFTVTTAGGRTGVATVNADGTFTFDGGDNFVSLVSGQTDSFTLNYTITGVRAPTAGTTICVEAESMTLNNYCVENFSGASGGKVVKGDSNEWNYASTSFSGQAGKYNIALKVLDEKDGAGTIRIMVNGVNVSGDITLNQNTSNDGFRILNVANLDLKPGDKVEIQGYAQGGEHARLDTLTFTATGQGGQAFTDTATVCVQINGEGSPLGCVTGRVFLDANGNNLETNGTGGFDAGVGGVTVQLINTAGAVAATTTSNADGVYSFAIAAGDYRVKFVAPSGLEFVTNDVGTDDTIDSDAGPGGITVGAARVVAGQTVSQIDAGLRAPTGCVTGRVFLDSNGDNLEINGTGGFDAGVGGVTVQLINTAGTVAATTTSDGNGIYSFQVAAGDYRVKFIAPSGLEFVTNDVGNDDTIDSDAGPGGITVGAARVVAGQTVSQIDAGLRAPLAVDAVDDGFSVGETQDIAANILANDSPQNGSLTVMSVVANGAAKTVGQSFTVTTEGGRTGTVTVNKDGTFTFDGGNNFVNLNQGQTDRFELTYTAAATTQVQAKYNLLFVLDISNSTIGAGGGNNVFNGTGVGDVNGDGYANTVLDAEIQGVINVINKLKAQGVNPANIDIGLVTFSGVAQGFATVNAATLGTFALNAGNLISTLTAIRSGGWTNYEAGLQEAEKWLNTQKGDGAENRLFFLSDGRPIINNVNGQDVLQTTANYGDEVSRIANGLGAQIHAIGIGANSDLAYLNQLDNTGGAVKVLDVGTLSTALDNATPVLLTDTAKVSVTINGEGAVVVVDAVDDAFVVAETQDISSNILANDRPQDGSLTVLALEANGGTRTVGQAFQVTTEGGRQGTVTVNKDGTFTFDGGNNFVPLLDGQTDRFQIKYTAAATQQMDKKYNLLFVLDISNSTIGAGGGNNVFNGTGVGDVNGDGYANTVLDAEIQGVINVINKLKAQGVNPANIDIGLVTFSGVAQGYATVDAATLGTFGLNAANLISTLTGIRSGGWTNYEAGLKQAETWLGTQTGDGAENRLFFLSDGRPIINNVNGQDVLQTTVNYGDEVARIAGTYGAQIHAIGIGANSDLAYLNQLDNTGGAVKVLDVGTLSTALDNATPVLITDQATVTVTINGQGRIASIDAVDDRIVVSETETTGDTETLVGGATSILANDTTESGPYAGAVVTVNGVAGNVGQFIDLAAGGKIKINANGTVDFSADGDFTGLNQGQSAEVRVNYSITKTVPAVLDGKLKYDLWNHVPTGPSIVNIPGGTGEYVGTVGNFDVNALALALTNDADTYKIRYTGQIQITTGGSYNFTIGGDDGVGIYIDGVQVAARDGIHAFESATGSVNLTAGAHNIEIRYFENTGGQGLAVSYQGPDTAGGQSSIFGAVNSGPITPTTITDTAAVIVTINGEGQPNILPVAVNDQIATDEDTPATPINVLANDNQGDGPATVVAVQGGTVGQPITLTTTEDGQVLTATATLSANGTLTLVPGAAFDLLDANESRSFTLTYTLRDANGDHSTATITLVVNGLNEGPDDIDDSNAGIESVVGLSGNVLTNDTDPNNDALTVVSAGGVPAGTAFAVSGVSSAGRALGGTVQVMANGNYGFVLGAGYGAMAQGETVTFPVSYTARDPFGATDTATLRLTINGVNEGPDAVDDIGSGIESVAQLTGNLLTNDTDPNNDALSVVTAGGVAAGTAFAVSGTSSAGRALGGTLTVQANGSYVFTLGAGYAAMAQGETVTFPVSYTARDPFGATDTATLRLTINGVNEGPDAVDDIGSGIESVAQLTGNLLTNDTDPNNDALSVVTAGGVAAGTAFAVSGTSSAGRALGGTLTVQANGSYVFTLGAGYGAMAQGETVTFPVSYTARDPFGATDTATLRLTINGVNEGPDAVDDIGSGIESVAQLTGNLLTNDTDPNNDALSVVTAGGVAAGTAFAVSGTSSAGRALGGTLTVQANGSYVFTLGAGYGAMAQGETVTFPVSYTARDPFGATDTATLRLTINGVNEGPDAVDDIGSGIESVAQLTGNLLTNDTDPNNDALSVVTAGGVAAGTAFAVSGTSSAGRALGGTLTVQANGSYVFTLGAGYAAMAQGETVTFPVTYTARDPFGATDTATLRLTINGVNEGPDAVDDIGSGIESVAQLTGNLLTNDTDPNNDALSVVTAGGVAAGTAFAVSGTSSAGRALGGTLTVQANGSYVFTLGAGYGAMAQGETVTFPVSYTARDPFGATDTATLRLTINGVNEGPDAVDDIGSGIESVAQLTGNLLTNDTDPNNDALSVVTAGGVAAGTAFAVSGTSSAGRALGGTLTVQADGSYVFTLGAGYAAMAQGETVTFPVSYTARDPFGATDTATLNLTINGLNEGPVASDNRYTTNEVTAVSGNLVTDDTGAGIDSDPNGDAITVTAVQGGTVGTGFDVTTDAGRHGTLTVGADGSFSFAPTTGFETLFDGQTDQVRFDYTLTDANGASDTASVTVVINGIDPTPTAANDQVTIGEVLPGTVNVLANDTGGDGPLSVATIESGSAFSGTSTTDGGRTVAWTINAGGELSVQLTSGAGTLFDGQADTVTLDYSIIDQDGDPSAAQVVVNILGSGTPPQPTRTLAVTGDIDTIGPDTQGIAAVIDISTRAFSGAAQTAVADLNGDGTAGTAVDASIQMVVDLARSLIAHGRGGQEIGVIGAGFNLTRTAEFTAQAIANAATAGNAAIASLFSTVIGITPNAPQVGTLSSGQRLFADTADISRGLTAADAYLTGQGAHANEILLLTATDGSSAALKTLVTAGRPVPVGTFVSGSTVFASDTTAINATLAAKHTDVDVVYIEAGARIALDAVGSALAAVDSDHFVSTVNITPLIALDTLVVNPTQVNLGDLAEFSLTVNGVVIDGIDLNDVTPNAAGFDFQTVLDVAQGDAQVQVHLGFNTDTDAQIELVRNITATVSGDTFHFNVDLEQLLLV